MPHWRQESQRRCGKPTKDPTGTSMSLSKSPLDTAWLKSVPSGSLLRNCQYPLVPVSSEFQPPGPLCSAMTGTPETPTWCLICREWKESFSSMIAETLGYSKGRLAVFQVGNGHCLLTASASFPDLFAWHLTSVAWPGCEQNLEPKAVLSWSSMKL